MMGAERPWDAPFRHTAAIPDAQRTSGAPGARPVLRNF
ncbi:hypothetical protein [Azospirillum largimobile]